MADMNPHDEDLTRPDGLFPVRLTKSRSARLTLLLPRDQVDEALVSQIAQGNREIAEINRKNAALRDGIVNALEALAPVASPGERTPAATATGILRRALDRAGMRPKQALPSQEDAE